MPSIKPLRSIISDEQMRDKARKVAWTLSLLTLLVWGVSYNNRIYDKARMTWWTYDPMMMSGFVTVFIGLLYNLLVDRNQFQLIKRLHDIAVVDLNATQLSKIRVLLRRYVLIWCLSITVGLVVLMILGYFPQIKYMASVCCELRDTFPIKSMEFVHSELRVRRSALASQCWVIREFIMASLFCSVLVGLRLGRTVANGFTGRAIRKISSSFEMVVQHPDGAGGLGHVGRFYLWQAVGLLFPTIWLAVWIWIIPYMETGGYNWLLPHFWRLLLVLTILWPFAVVTPMLSFHRLIVTWKAEYLEPAVANMRTNFQNLRANHLISRDQRREIRDLFDYLHSLTSLPNWPVSSSSIVFFFTTVVIPVFSTLLGTLIGAIIKN